MRRALSGPAQPVAPPRYAGQRVALLTQHGKERVIAAALEPVLNCRVELARGYDTDLLGTFTRDIPRAGTQLEAARQKARLGMELAGLPLGLASEGSFGPDPMAGMFPWNVEFLIWIDDRLGIEVVGVAQGKTNFAHVLTASWEETEAFARRAGFPEHHLVVRPEGENDPRLRKGITDWADLQAAFARTLDQSESWSSSSRPTCVRTPTLHAWTTSAWRSRSWRANSARSVRPAAYRASGSSSALRACRARTAANPRARPAPRSTAASDVRTA